MASPNIFTAKFEPDPADPEGFHASVVEVGRLAGGQELIVRLFEIEPGSHLCPYHYEYVEEWLIVLSGPVEIRTPDGTRALTDGEVVVFARGPSGAHRISSPEGAGQPARVIMMSPTADPAICVYPDSDKLAVFSNAVPADEVFVRRAEPSSHLEYFDGERP